MALQMIHDGTRWSSNFNGDINLLLKLDYGIKKNQQKKVVLLGLGIHQEYPLQTAIVNFRYFC